MTPPTDPSNPGADPLQARLLALEESHAFLERRVEQLDAELAGSTRRLAEVISRLARLEAGPPQAVFSPPVTAAPEVHTLAQAERRAIAAAMEQDAPDLDRAAAALGIDRATLERKLIQHGLA